MVDQTWDYSGQNSQDNNEIRRLEFEREEHKKKIEEEVAVGAAIGAAVYAFRASLHGLSCF